MTRSFASISSSTTSERIDDTGCESDDGTIPVILPTFEWEDLINDSLLKPCLKTLMTDIKSLKKGVSHMVQKFTGQTPGYNWNMEDASLAQGTGQTSPKYNHSTGTVTSKFDTQSWKDATDLSWVRTILHESIHANMVAYYSTNRPGFLGTYPQMIQDWGTFQNWNDVHHEEFARSLVKGIADALEEYGMAKGYKMNRTFYEDMSWAGLQGTSSFTVLPAADRQRILNTNSVELTKTDLNGKATVQKGKPAGC